MSDKLTDKQTTPILHPLLARSETPRPSRRSHPDALGPQPRISGRVRNCVAKLAGNFGIRMSDSSPPPEPLLLLSPFFRGGPESILVRVESHRSRRISHDFSQFGEARRPPRYHIGYLEDAMRVRIPDGYSPSTHI